MKIGKKEIGGAQVFIIAEIGNNHNGSLELALEMIDSAIDAGADNISLVIKSLLELIQDLKFLVLLMVEWDWRLKNQIEKHYLGNF